jgi:hypothetical protein
MLKVAKMFVNPYSKGGKMVAFADVIFSLTDGGDGVLKVSGCKIFKGDDGQLSLALPSRKDEKDATKWYPVMSIDKEKKDGQEMIAYLNAEATKAYNAKLKGGGDSKPKSNAPKSEFNNNTLDDADLIF